MNFLVVGSGGREHTIAWRLENDGSAENVYVLPGNGGIAPEKRVNLNIDDHEGIYQFCLDKKIDLVAVGPEAPLVAGLVDYLTERQIPAFGPSAQAAQLEGSKIFAKMIMDKYDVPTAGYHEFNGKAELLAYLKDVKKFPLVIKLDGLAAGKGVGIPESYEEAVSFTEEMVKEDSNVFVEDFLTGEEASVLGICDGQTVKPMIAAQDHKRIFDGDKGPNTGGMGAYAPAPVVKDAAMLEKIRVEVLQKVVDGMAAEGIPFKGILYAGLMIENEEIKVLEFNVRFGDPETQVVLPLLDSKLGDLFMASVKGTLAQTEMKFKEKQAMTVVLSSEGYPGSYEKGKEIKGTDLNMDGVTVFHAGTEIVNQKLVTAGGRVLAVTGMGDTLEEARDKAYAGVEQIEFAGAFHRQDIGHRAFARK